MQDLLNLEILTKTFDDLPVGVGIFKVEDLSDIKSIRYVFMNKVLLYEMRKEKEEVIGKRIMEVAPEAYEHEGGLLVLETYRRIAEEGGSVNLGLVEYSNHMVAGTYECSVHHIQDNYVYVMLRNVTELEQTKNKLELKNKELSQFAYIVSHDLKEPLRTVSSYIEFIQDNYKEQLDEQANDMFSIIFNSANRMTFLVTDLLALSSVGQANEKTAVDCGKLVEDVKQDLAAKIKETNTTIVVGQLPTIRGAETELRLVFQNLLSNAMKFFKPDVEPIIKVSAKEEEEAWTFAIEDNGIGIAEEHKEKIFNIFQRLHLKEEFEGTGIGLAHCQKVIDWHKGKLWVESELGEGSTFYFSIPKH